MGGKSTKDEYPSPSTPNMASMERGRGDGDLRPKKTSRNQPTSPPGGRQRNDHVDHHHQQLDGNKIIALPPDQGGDDEHNQFTPSKRGSFKRGSSKRSSWKRGSNALSKFGQSIR